MRIGDFASPALAEDARQAQSQRLCRRLHRSEDCDLDEAIIGVFLLAHSANGNVVHSFSADRNGVAAADNAQRTIWAEGGQLRSALVIVDDQYNP